MSHRLPIWSLATKQIHEPTATLCLTNLLRSMATVSLALTTTLHCLNLMPWRFRITQITKSGTHWSQYQLTKTSCGTRSFFLIWDGIPHYFRTLTWTTLSKKTYKHNLIDWQTCTHWLFTSLLPECWMFYGLSFCDVILFFMCRRAGLILICRAGTCCKPVFKMSQACLIGIVMLLLIFFCLMKEMS